MTASKQRCTHGGVYRVDAERRLDLQTECPYCEIERLRARNDLLQRGWDELLATVKGECPSLVNEDSGGSQVLIDLMIAIERSPDETDDDYRCKGCNSIDPYEHHSQCPDKTGGIHGR